MGNKQIINYGFIVLLIAVPVIIEAANTAEAMFLCSK
jgi:hypothetical protein